MRKFILAAAAMAPLAFAQPAAADTIDEIVKHGMVLIIQGMEIDVTYTADGKFTAADGQVTGTWKKDGTKMCSSSNFDPNETCTEFPADKKSGDSFDITNPMGTVTIRIK
jgi:hypothetical protein